MDIVSIICGFANLTDLPDVIGSTFGVSVEVLAADTSWTSFQVGPPDSSLVFTKYALTRPQDDYSKSKLRILNFTRNIQTSAPNNKEYILGKMAKSKVTLGAEAKNGFNVESRHVEIILATAALTDGIVFTGRDFLSVTGDIILSQDGAYDVKI